jgi:hypothetical protein
VNSNPNGPTLADVLAAIERIETEVATTRQELRDEVKRWDERFFKFAEDTANRANTLIASATIAVIAGTLLLILREGSQP